VHLPAVYGLAGLAALYQAAPLPAGRFACCADTRASGALPPSPVTIAGAVAAAAAKKDEKTEPKKGSKKVEENKIELSREEWQKLLRDSDRLSTVTEDLARAKASAAEAEGKRVEMQKKLEESEKLNAAFLAERARVECERIGTQVEEQVKAGRLEPGKKESTIAYVLTLKAEERIAYLKTLENLPTMFGEKASVPAPENAGGDDMDAVYEQAIALQKKTGVTYEEASRVILDGMGA
jgi:hypothetical protein